MLVRMPVLPLAVSFRDREGNTRETVFYVPSSIPDDTLVELMNIVIAAVQPLSDAFIWAWEARYTLREDSPNDADVNTDLARQLALFYRNEEDYEAIYIPAAKLSLMEVTGPYAGIRLDASRPDVADLLQLFQQIVEFIVTPEGDEFPQQFAVGGLTL